MIKRNLFILLEATLEKYPIVVLTGPRQSGKTTLLRTMLPGYRYVSMEDPDIRSFAVQDPKAFLEEYDNRVIFDEVQQASQLFSYLQRIVDERNEMGQFILSGSQNFNLLEKITQSLAGRVAIFRLFPFDLEEMKNAGWLSDDLSKVFCNGFYPAIFQRKINPDRYYADYIDTYINRDITQIINLHNHRTFKIFIKLCANRAGQLVNYNDLARDTGISHTTVRNWLSILETSYIVFLLNPYYKNYSKRVVKSPKLYFYDTGLLCHLLDFRKGNISPLNAFWGSIFENMIISELHKKNQHLSQFRVYWFWRDSHGNEIDLLYPHSGNLNIYEIKSSSTIKNSLFNGLNKFSSIAIDEIRKKTLVYGGTSNQKRSSYSIQAWHNVS